jgi:hypothetical protein
MNENSHSFDTEVNVNAANLVPSKGEASGQDLPRALTHAETEKIKDTVRKDKKNKHTVDSLVKKFSKEFKTRITEETVELVIREVVIEEVDADLKSGKIASMACSNIGVAGITDVKFMQKDGKYVARVGIALMGSAHETDIEDPFHPEYPNNYAEGVGDSTEEALAAMRVRIKEISDSLHH